MMDLQCIVIVSKVTLYIRINNSKIMQLNDNQRFIWAHKSLHTVSACEAIK